MGWHQQGQSVPAMATLHCCLAFALPQSVAPVDLMKLIKDIGNAGTTCHWVRCMSSAAAVSEHDEWSWVCPCFDWSLHASVPDIVILWGNASNLHMLIVPFLWSDWENHGLSRHHFSNNELDSHRSCPPSSQCCLLSWRILRDWEVGFLQVSKRKFNSGTRPWFPDSLLQKGRHVKNSRAGILENNTLVTSRCSSRWLLSCCVTTSKVSNAMRCIHRNLNAGRQNDQRLK